MRSWSGKDYSLHVVEGDAFAGAMAPGALMVIFGEAIVYGRGSTRSVYPGEAVEVLEDLTPFHVNGLIGIATEFWVPPHIDEGRIGVTRPVEVVRHEKPWGYELEPLLESKELQLKFLHVGLGHATSLQRHEHKEETIIFVDGSREDPWHITPGTAHRVDGDEQRRFYFEASTYHPDDVVRLEDRYGR